MIRLEFEYGGKTYEASLGADVAPHTVKLSIRPCALKPPVELQLQWLATDELRGLELYRPFAVIHK